MVDVGKKNWIKAGTKFLIGAAIITLVVFLVVQTIKGDASIKTPIYVGILGFIIYQFVRLGFKTSAGSLTGEDVFTFILLAVLPSIGLFFLPKLGLFSTFSVGGISPDTSQISQVLGIFGDFLMKYKTWIIILSAIMLFFGDDIKRFRRNTLGL